MTERERFLRTMRYQPVDHPPLHLVGVWKDTVERWYGEGLPRGADPNEYLGVRGLRIINVSGNVRMYPEFQTRTIEEDETHKVFADEYGRTVRNFKDHTSMPQWLAFSVKDRESFQRVLDEHYSIRNLDERFPSDWEETVRRAGESGDLILIDGGCYYWTLRSLAGVERASYLLHDAPDLVDELFERYLTVVLEGIRRATTLVRVDLIGFGEDIAYKNGPLLSPQMFRRFILPRYRAAMQAAQAKGIDLTWYDSDGDLRQLIPDYLDVGIHTLAPCEVAANMVPSALRREFGKDLRLIGGIDKRAVARGRAAIDAEIERNRAVIDEGGFLPAIDHSVSADISFDDYRYFLEAIQQALGIV